ncbi:hypothetical protein PLESTB_000337800 [Pleodorina starrii]|uniref:Uncharacterized protein n=1 Tax=Pleodorina starrii TaxID=330485 RepID=A0A9W6BDG0_9CHLO|nr:hypothetical protein PLESTB_000337800 [Pleodorina starrii]
MSAEVPSHLTQSLNLNGGGRPPTAPDNFLEPEVHEGARPVGHTPARLAGVPDGLPPPSARRHPFRSTSAAGPFQPARRSRPTSPEARKFRRRCSGGGWRGRSCRSAAENWRCPRPVGGAATRRADPAPLAAVQLDPPQLAAVPLDPPQLAAVPLDPPQLAAVPLDPPQLAAAPLDPPQLAAVPLDPPQLAAVPLDPPQLAAVPLDPPQLAAVPLDPPQLVAVPLDPPQLAAVPLDLPQLAAVPLDPPQLAAAPQPAAQLALPPAGRPGPWRRRRQPPQRFPPRGRLSAPPAATQAPAVPPLDGALPPPDPAAMPPGAGQPAGDARLAVLNAMAEGQLTPSGQQRPGRPR